METWIYVIIASIVLIFGYSRGEIRCYCNDASCINKGYMCKSSIDRCFSILTPDGATAFRSVHGCAELLSGLPSSTCSQQEADYFEYDTTGSSGVNQLRSRVICCAEDMCNYNADSASGHAVLDPVASARDSKGNSWMNGMQGHKTSDQKLVDDFPDKRPSRGQHIHEDTLRRDVWFRAAVIAVPIAGLVILILLVLLAVRMLRGDYVIKTSSTNPDQPHISVAVADECGVVRTVLAPPGECTHAKRLCERETAFKLDSSKRPKYEKFRPSSDCSESELCHFCHGHVRCITMVGHTDELPV